MLFYSLFGFIKTIYSTKYIELNKKIEKDAYFENVDVYIYSRNNWKLSGRISGFKVFKIKFKE
jgi:sRNA-binding regulator protein Hfq